MKEDYILGIILNDSSLYNKVLNNLDLKGKKIKYYTEATIYEEGKIFFSTLKEEIGGVIYLTQDDYVTEIIKNDEVNKETEATLFILAKALDKLKIPLLHLIIPFNMTKKTLSDLQGEIDNFYKGIEK